MCVRLERLPTRTFRFKSRVWFLKPMDAHSECSKCSGKTVLWMYGNEIYRVTGRKDEYAEVQEFICNECRFEKKDPGDWVIEGPRKIKRNLLFRRTITRSYRSRR